MDEIETIFGYAQTVVGILFRTVARGRMTTDDKRSVVYYCQLIIKKIREDF
jgi:hypothetical protein